MPDIDLQVSVGAGKLVYDTGSGLVGKTPSEADALATQSLNAQTGTTYTFVLADPNRLTTLSNASPITATVPPNSSVAFPIGCVIPIAQLGAGQVTVAAGVGVTLNVAKDAAGVELFVRKLSGQNAEASLTKLATNTWLLTGVLEAV